VCLVTLDAHASAATIPLLSPAQLAVHEFQIDRHSGGHAREQRNQSFSMRLTGCRKAQHGNRQADCS
jgi:hypothetical protein